MYPDFVVAIGLLKVKGGICMHGLNKHATTTPCFYMETQVVKGIKNVLDNVLTSHSRFNCYVLIQSFQKKKRTGIMEIGRAHV